MKFMAVIVQSICISEDRNSVEIVMSYIMKTLKYKTPGKLHKILLLWEQ